MFGSNNPGSQFWKKSLSNESPGFQCIWPLQNRAIDTCLSHYSHAPPQEVLNNTLAEQTSGSWTHKPFALAQGRHFSAIEWTIKLRDHITQDLLLPWVFPTTSAAEHLRHRDVESTPLTFHLPLLLLQHSPGPASSQQKNFHGSHICCSFPSPYYELYKNQIRPTDLLSCLSHQIRALR